MYNERLNWIFKNIIKVGKPVNIRYEKDWQSGSHYKVKFNLSCLPEWVFCVELKLDNPYEEFFVMVEHIEFVDKYKPSHMYVTFYYENENCNPAVDYMGNSFNDINHFIKKVKSKPKFFFVTTMHRNFWTSDFNINYEEVTDSSCESEYDAYYLHKKLDKEVKDLDTTKTYNFVKELSKQDKVHGVGLYDYEYRFPNRGFKYPRFEIEILVNSKEKDLELEKRLIKFRDDNLNIGREDEMEHIHDYEFIYVNEKLRPYFIRLFLRNRFTTHMFSKGQLIWKRKDCRR